MNQVKRSGVLGGGIARSRAVVTSVPWFTVCPDVTGSPRSQTHVDQRPKEALREFSRGLHWLALVAAGAAVGLNACGASTSTTASASALASALASTPTAIATPGPTPAPATCPTASKVEAALGFAVPKPVGVPYSGPAQLPAGAAGIACEYRGASFNVLIERISNIDPSYIAQFSARFPVAFSTVPAVGDQARSFSQPLGGGKVNEGVVATKGRTLVYIIATATPASLAQIDALTNQLL